MIIVTSGKKYIDIDAYAGCIAYAQLLNLKGIEAKAISTAKINESITPSLLDLPLKLDNYEPKENDKYVVIDVSNKDYFDTFVEEDRVIEIIDHHVGYEEYWNNKLKDKSKIEFIGAVATIVLEFYEKEGLIDKISKDTALLLMSAILDNTLNLKAKVTTERDIIAYNKLEKIIGDEKYTKNYPEKYFKECQLKINNDLVLAIQNDTKIEHIDYVLPPIFSQLVIWNKDSILQKKDTIYKTLNNIGEQWVLNLICLEDGKSYLISNNLENKKSIEKLFNKKFEKDIMILNNVWLRKEIMKLALDK